MLEIGDIVKFKYDNNRFGIIEKSISGRLKVRYISINDSIYTKLIHYRWKYESLASDKFANDAINDEWIIVGV